MRNLTTAVVATMAMISGLAAPGAHAQEATPTSLYRCETPMAASPMAGMMMEPAGDMPMGDMPMGASTPMAGMGHMAMEIDQMYIDMMIPHHQSIIAMSEAALPRLSDERLREIAQAVIITQQPEIDELRGHREALYGDANPMPMDGGMASAMMEMMPGMSGTMDEMAMQMSAGALVAEFCAAENADLAFVDLTIPHHQMAIEASEAVLEQAVHPEIRDVAQRVIDAQEREIETLTEIRAELTDSAMPERS